MGKLRHPCATISMDTSPASTCGNSFTHAAHDLIMWGFPLGNALAPFKLGPNPGGMGIFLLLRIEFGNEGVKCGNGIHGSLRLQSNAIG